LLVILSSFNVVAQTNSTVNCQELFFSELQLVKVGTPPYSLEDYAIEIFNPTASTVSLSNYSCILRNTTGGSITFAMPVGAYINSNDVYVITSSTSTLPLQQLADFVSPALNFSTYSAIDLLNGGFPVDQVGAYITSNAAPFDVTSFLNSPISYLTNNDILLNEVNYLSLKRKYSVQSGKVPFDATDIISNWEFLPSGQGSSIGVHNSNCWPLGTTSLEFELGIYELGKCQYEPEVNYQHIGPTGVWPRLIGTVYQNTTSLDFAGIATFSVSAGNCTSFDPGPAQSLAYWTTWEPNADWGWDYIGNCLNCSASSSSVTGNISYFSPSTGGTQVTNLNALLGPGAIKRYDNYRPSCSSTLQLGGNNTFNSFNSTAQLFITAKDCSTTSLDENADEAGTEVKYIFDSKQLYVHLHGRGQYTVFGLAGGLAMHGKLDSGTSLVDVSDLPSGVYHVRLVGDTGKHRDTKFVKWN
jgi:hypothetical protein